MNRFYLYLINKIKINNRFIFGLLYMLPIFLFIFLVSDKNTTINPFIKNMNTEPVHQEYIQNTYGKLPMYFEANHGQFDDTVKFMARGAGYILFLTPDEAVLSFQEPQNKIRKFEKRVDSDSTKPSKISSVSIKLVGANIFPRVEGIEKLSGKSNYFIGNDAKDWHTDIPNYLKVRYKKVYPGIDLIYYGNQRQLEYDFIVAPHFDPNQIFLRFEGADSISIDEKGNLILQINDREVVFKSPEIYQEIDGEKREVNGAYRNSDNREIGFVIGDYNDEIPLIIDPKLIYATYLGGNSNDYGWDIAVDTLGHAYVVGETFSTDFPTKNAMPNMPIGNVKAGQNIFLAKLNPEGDGLIFSTYIGGSGREAGLAIAIDLEGNSYITGPTSSPDFPTVNALDAEFEPDGNDGFVVKINSKGSGLVFSTYLGGSYNEFPRGIAVDRKNNVYIGGYTGSVDFPTVNPYQEFPGDYDYGSDSTSFGNIFVTKLNPMGNGIVFSTYIGGQWNDNCYDIAIDSSGNVYLTGYSTSTDFPLVNSYQSSYLSAHPGWSMAVVCKLDSSGSNLLYSTYLGGDGQDIGYDIAVDSLQCAYVVGRTGSSNFPTKNAIMGPPSGILNGAGFITKFTPPGNTLIFSSYLTGTDHSTTAYGVVVDQDNFVYISGQNNATDFPLLDPIKPGVKYPGSFVYVLDPSGQDVLYSTSLLSGYGYQGHEIAIDQYGDIYLTGVVSEWAKDFPVQNAYQKVPGGKDDAFVAKIGIVDDAVWIVNIVPNPFSDSTEYFWVEGTVRPGEKWTFYTDFRYNLVSADSGDVQMVVQTHSGILLGENSIPVKRGVNIFKEHFTSPEVTIPEVDLDDVDTLYVKLKLIPANAPNETAADSISYRIFIHKWTFMVYLDGDNDLEWASVDDFFEMSETPSNDSIAVVIQYDRHPEYDNWWFNLETGDWSEAYGWADTRRIFDHRDYFLEESIGEQNMGDPTTLRNFVQWAMKKFPAQHYALILWNHGGGWRASSSATFRSGLRKETQSPIFPKLPPDGRGWNRDYKDVIVDETDNDVLYSSEIRMALRGLPKLDILAFDACLMSMVENAYQYRNLADYMVGSEALEPGSGWPYNTILARLHDRPKMAANVLASVIVNEYGFSYSPDDLDITQAANNLWEIAGVANALDELAAILIQKRPWYEVETAMKQSKYFWPTENRDIYHFAQLLKNISNDQSIQDACEKLLNALSRTTIANYHSLVEENSNGLSIFFPKVLSQYDASYDQDDNIQLSDDTQWDEFLRLFLSRGRAVVDTYEPNDFQSQAYGPLFPKTDYYSYFPYPGDKDFYFFTTGNQTNLTVKLTSPTNSWDIAVFDFNGTLLGQSSSTTSADSLSLFALSPSSYYIEIISNDISFPETPYKLEVDYEGSLSGKIRLSFDDNEPDSSIFSTNSGDLVGMRFHAPTYPMRLDEISFYIESIDGAGTGGDGAFYVWLADYYGTIIEPFLVTPASGTLQKSSQLPGWFNVSFSDSAITIQSDFIVGIGYDGTNTPALGIDSLDNGRTFKWDSGTNTWGALETGAFIRATVSYPEALDRVRISLPAELQVQPGDSILLPVGISNVPTTGIDSLDLEIYYETSTFGFTALRKENSLTLDWNLDKFDTQPAGRIYIRMSGGKKISGSGNLFNLQFYVQNIAQSDTVELSINQIQLNGGQHYVETKNTNIIINTTSPVYENLGQPKRFELWQNYPNPFSAGNRSILGGNPSTIINYDVPYQSDVIIEIFDLLGRKIQTLVNRNHFAGSFSTTWDGRNSTGESVANGIYIYKMSVNNNHVHIKKMIFIR